MKFRFYLYNRSFIYCKFLLNFPRIIVCKFYAWTETVSNESINVQMAFIVKYPNPLVTAAKQSFI